MGTVDWIFLGLLVGGPIVLAIRQKAWTNPRVLVPIVLLVVAAAAVGGLMGLMLGAVESFSVTAF